MDLTKALKQWLVKNAGVVDIASDEVFKTAAVNAIKDGKLTLQQLADLTKSDADGASARDVFGNIRVKNPSERYSTTKSVGKHSKTGLPVRDERGREAELPSELEYAKTGALIRHLASKSGVSGIVLSEHEHQLLAETCETDLWAGDLNNEYKFGIPMSKAILDDATSGGLEVTPIWFDEALVSYPLLHSELLPYVNLIEVPRGRRIEGSAIGNPTLTWGTAEGTAIDLFDTAGLISALDSTIFNAVAAIEMGLDFLSDSPAAVGKIVSENLGQRLLKELDKVIAEGSGTTEPQGVAVASGLLDIGNPSGGAGATATVSDYESLLFAVGKQYRSSANRCCFIANDTTYSRARGIAVGASDQRRVFGMDHSSYMLLEYPFRICNDLPNNFCAFGALAKYKLYRRVGQAIRFETGGKTLALANQGLLVSRSRFGGRVVDPSAFSFSDNWKA